MNISTRAESSTKAQGHKQNNWPQLDMAAVRAHFIHRGSSLHQWTRARGFVLESVRQAILGTRRGPHSTFLINELLKEIGHTNQTTPKGKK